MTLLVSALILCFTVIPAKTENTPQRKADYDGDIQDSITKAKAELKPLRIFDSNGYSDSVLSYFKYYGLDFANDKLKHTFGRFESNGFYLAGHIFEPKEYKATVVILPGFFDHCGQLKHLIAYLIEAGFAVAAFDMPGHGLSSGQKAAIDDFSQYSAALSDFVDIVKLQLKGPFYLIGHSLGAATSLDYLFTSEDVVFDKVVLAAPLVRSYMWNTSKLGYKLYSPFAESIGRVFRNNSSDKEFLDFLRTKDPLQTKEVPLKWIKALYEWNDKIVPLPACNKSVMIIQGTNDKTVSWRFNIKFIRSKFKDTRVSLIKNGRHELFNESAEIRTEVFRQISRYLENRPTGLLRDCFPTILFWPEILWYNPVVSEKVHSFRYKPSVLQLLEAKD